MADRPGTAGAAQTLRPPRSGPSSPLTVTALPSVDAARDDWERLGARSVNIFSTWEWADAWWRHFGRDGALRLFSCRDGTGETVAILPLYLWRSRGLRIARLIGHRGGDQLGAICDPADDHLVAASVAAALEQARADLLFAEHLPGVAWSARLHGTRLSTQASPTLRLGGGGWEDYLRGRSASFRSGVRRRERKVFDRHEAAYRLADDPGRLQRDLDDLFRLHALRWAGTRTNFAQRERFHREFAAVALERGWLRLLFLDIDGAPRAANYSFRFQGVEFAYQSGRDPAWNASSPGSVLLTHQIRLAHDDALREVRLLRGDEAYKYTFATEDHGLENVVVARTAVGSAAGAMLVAARRARSLQQHVGAAWAARRGVPEGGGASPPPRLPSEREDADATGSAVRRGQMGLR